MAEVVNLFKVEDEAWEAYKSNKAQSESATAAMEALFKASDLQIAVYGRTEAADRFERVARAIRMGDL